MHNMQANVHIEETNGKPHQASAFRLERGPRSGRRIILRIVDQRQRKQNRAPDRNTIFAFSGHRQIAHGKRAFQQYPIDGPNSRIRFSHDSLVEPNAIDVRLMQLYPNRDHDRTNRSTGIQRVENFLQFLSSSSKPTQSRRSAFSFTGSSHPRTIQLSRRLSASAPVEISNPSCHRRRAVLPHRFSVILFRF